MRKFILILSLMAINISFVLGQTPGDTITIFKMHRGYQYFKGDKQLNVDELAFAMHSNSYAYQMVRLAQANHTFAVVLAVAGGAMIGWPIGKSIGGKELNMLLAGAGIATVGLGLVVGTHSERQKKLAVELFNEGLGTISLRNPLRSIHELRLSLSEYGVGLALKF